MDGKLQIVKWTVSRCHKTNVKPQSRDLEFDCSSLEGIDWNGHMNDSIGWVIDGHAEKACVIKQSPVCAQVTLMAISNKHKAGGEERALRSMSESRISKQEYSMWREITESKGQFWNSLLCYLESWDVNPKSLQIPDHFIKHGQFFFIKTNSPSCFHCHACVQIIFSPRGLYEVTSSIMCRGEWLWFLFQHLISSISRRSPLFEAASKWQWYIRRVTKTIRSTRPDFCTH